jgi:hypothetical protein
MTPVNHSILQLHLHLSGLPRAAETAAIGQEEVNSDLLAALHKEIECLDAEVQAIETQCELL